MGQAGECGYVGRRNPGRNPVIFNPSSTVVTFFCACSGEGDWVCAKQSEKSL